MVLKKREEEIDKPYTRRSRYRAGLCSIPVFLGRESLQQLVQSAFEITVSSCRTKADLFTRDLRVQSEFWKLYTNVRAYKKDYLHDEQILCIVSLVVACYFSSHGKE